jgi:hypothetical protein
LEPVEVIRTPSKVAFDLRASRGGDTEATRPVVFEEQTVVFAVVHHHRVRCIDVWVGSSPPVIFVVVVGFEFTECLVNDELGGVVDVIGVIHDSRFDVVPIPPLAVEAVGFVADAAGLNTAGLQIVSTPRMNI